MKHRENALNSWLSVRFPYALCGYALWTLARVSSKTLIDRSIPKSILHGRDCVRFAMRLWLHLDLSSVMGKGICSSLGIPYKHYVLTRYQQEKVLMEGFSLIFGRERTLKLWPWRSQPLKLRGLKVFEVGSKKRLFVWGHRAVHKQDSGNSLSFTLTSLLKGRIA